MKSTLDMNRVSTLSAQLLANLDETVFFSLLSGFIAEEFIFYQEFKKFGTA